MPKAHLLATLLMLIYELLWAEITILTRQKEMLLGLGFRIVDIIADCIIPVLTERHSLGKEKLTLPLKSGQYWQKPDLIQTKPEIIGCPEK